MTLLHLDYSLISLVEACFIATV